MRIDRFITLHLMRPLLGDRGSRITAAVPILMYHSISDDPETGRSDYYKTCTSPDRFRGQSTIFREKDPHPRHLKK